MLSSVRIKRSFNPSVREACTSKLLAELMSILSCRTTTQPFYTCMHRIPHSSSIRLTAVDWPLPPQPTTEARGSVSFTDSPPTRRKRERPGRGEQMSSVLICHRNWEKVKLLAFIVRRSSIVRSAQSSLWISSSNRKGLFERAMSLRCVFFLSFARCHASRVEHHLTLSAVIRTAQ